MQTDNNIKPFINAEDLTDVGFADKTLFFKCYGDKAVERLYSVQIFIIHADIKNRIQYECHRAVCLCFL